MAESSDPERDTPGKFALGKGKHIWGLPGMRQIERPPQGASSIEVADHYLRAYEDEYYRTRLIVKWHANFLVFVSAGSSALVSVLGAFSAVVSTGGWRWISIVIAAVAGFATVVAAWGAHSSPRRHWIQKTSIVNTLTRHRMWFEGAMARGDDAEFVAEKTFELLDKTFDEDLAGWRRMLDPNNNSSDSPADKPELEVIGEPAKES